MHHESKMRGILPYFEGLNGGTSMKKTIAIVAGGFSHEAQISFKSAETVMNNIDREHFIPYQVNITEQGWYGIVDGTQHAIDKGDFSIVSGQQRITFDAVFIAIHGTPGEDGKLQSYFELIGMPYTTSGPLASALSFSKYVTNNVLRYNGIHCAHSQLLRKGMEVNLEVIGKNCGFPCFVKPNNGGSSFGMSRVNQPEDLAKAIERAFEHDDEVLVESFIEGTEVTCGIFRLDDQFTVLPITEIVSENEFFDFDAKYKGESQEITPARIPQDQWEAVQILTKKVYQLLGLKGLARVDFMIQESDNTPFVIEANTVPGLSAESLIPQQLEAHGVTMKAVFGQLLNQAIDA